MSYSWVTPAWAYTGFGLPRSLLHWFLIFPAAGILSFQVQVSSKVVESEVHQPSQFPWGTLKPLVTLPHFP